MKDAVLTCLKQKYFVIDGRASRSEFWFFSLFAFVATLVFLIVGLLFAVLVSYISQTLGGIISFLVALSPLVFIIPSITVTIRRLHDQDKPGLLVLLGLIPAIGGLIVLILMCLPGTQGDNKYGPDPLAK